MTYPEPPHEPGMPVDGYPQPAVTGDPLGVAAIVVGCIGLVVLGVGLAIVTAVLAAIAGSQARAHGRSLENAYIAFVLAALDGVVWLVLHMIFDISFVAG